MDKLTRFERILTYFYRVFMVLFGIVYVPAFLVFMLVYSVCTKGGEFFHQVWIETTGLPGIIELPRHKKAREVAAKLRGDS